MAETKITRIYVLRDPRTNEIRYVGQTKLELKKRLSRHISNALGDRVSGGRFAASARKALTHRDSWIRSLDKTGLRPIIEGIEEAGDDWPERERYWIAFYRQAGARLTNRTDGGEGTPGYVHTPEMREFRSQLMTDLLASPGAAQRREKFIAASTAPETRAKHKIALLVKVQDPAHRARLASQFADVLTDPEWKANQSERMRTLMLTDDRLKAMHTPELEARRSVAVKASWTPERRALMSAKAKAQRTREIAAKAA